MPLIHLYDPLKNEQDFHRFADYNYSDHLIITNTLQTVKSITVDLLDIRVLFLDEIGVWALNHQVMHDAVNAALGFAGSDFTHIDLNDPTQVDSMRQLHAEEHRQWHVSLGI